MVLLGELLSSEPDIKQQGISIEEPIKSVANYNFVYVFENDDYHKIEWCLNKDDISPQDIFDKHKCTL